MLEVSSRTRGAAVTWVAIFELGMSVKIPEGKWDEKVGTKDVPVAFSFSCLFCPFPVSAVIKDGRVFLSKCLCGAELSIFVCVSPLVFFVCVLCCLSLFFFFFFVLLSFFLTNKQVFPPFSHQSQKSRLKNRIYSPIVLATEKRFFVLLDFFSVFCALAASFFALLLHPPQSTMVRIPHRPRARPQPHQNIH